MDAIIITTTLGEDRKLNLDLPPDMPTGPITVTIEANKQVKPEKELTRDEVRAILLKAGALSTAKYAPPRCWSTL
jgi:hypothetical protein